MNRTITTGVLMIAIILLIPSFKSAAQIKNSGTLLKDVTLIDGNGGKPRQHIDVLIQGDSIAAIGQKLNTAGLFVIDLKGKIGDQNAGCLRYTIANTGTPPYLVIHMN